MLIDSQLRKLSVFENGQFLINGEKLPLSKLEQSVGELIKNNNSKDVTIIATNGVTVQDMVNAMDKIKKAGGLNVSFADAG